MRICVGVGWRAYISFAAALVLPVAGAIGALAGPPAELAHCESCHGANGNSTSGSVPRLNGQMAAYLKDRLKSFLDPGSQDPHATEAMWGVVTKVDDATLAELADFFAKQPPSQPNIHSSLSAAGQRLYEMGDAKDFIPACKTCHGLHGEGHDVVARLAGQHSIYLTNQLERMRLNLRAHAVMHANTNSMTDDQIKALVAYLGND